jgi:hypothetical protein
LIRLEVSAAAAAAAAPTHHMSASAPAQTSAPTPAPATTYASPESSVESGVGHKAGIDCAAPESVNEFVTDQNRLPDIHTAFGCIDDIDSSAYDFQEQGRDILETTPADTAPTFSSTKVEVMATLKRNEVCFLHQKPGFGKTRIIMELLSKESFLIIFLPTKVLRAQVTFHA